MSNPPHPPIADLSNSESENHLHRLGYRAWTGHLAPGWTRWMVIADVGIRRAWQNRWLKRLLFSAWLPALYFGIGFFIWEQAALYPEWRHLLRPLLRSLPQTETFQPIKDAVSQGDLGETRHLVWSWLLNLFVRYPQPIVMVLVIGLIAPPLISQDIRSRAFLLYFSRPIARVEYMIGKLATVWIYLAMISLVPALVMYLIGVVLSPNLKVVAATWDIPLRILAATLVLIIPTSSLALCLSSLTQETRIAGFAWFAIWVLGWFTYGAVSSAEAFNQQQAFRQHRQLLPAQESNWTHLSMYHTVGRVQSYLFGFSKLQDAMFSMILLGTLTVVSLSTLFYRISAPMRV